MSLRVEQWAEADFSRVLTQRLAHAKAYRKRYEGQWTVNEELYYNSAPRDGVSAGISADGSTVEDTGDDSKLGVRDVALNYISRDIRYLHATMSSNPPTVKIIPTSTDMADEERADAADIVARWAREHYHHGEVADQRNLKTLTKGTGYIRYPWDSTLGKVIQFSEATGELLMSGDIRHYSPSTWDIWLDPNARCSDVQSIDGPRWFFEELDMTLEEAMLRFHKFADQLKKAVGSGPKKNKWRFWEHSGDARAKDGGEDRVQVYFYAEKGEAVNGMQGRQAYMLESGLVLEFGANEQPGGDLGLDVLTDIDVEDEPYGKSLIEYLGAVQLMIQSLDANTLRNVAAHSAIRMYVDDATTLSDEALTDDGLDIIRGSGAPPTFLNPPSQLPDAWKLRDQLHAGGRDISMVNEAMLGQSSRETSGFTTQTQISQGNMGRRRLYNKFTTSTKHLVYCTLGLIIQNWDEPRKVQILGVERAYEVHSFDATDLDGGWDIIAEYGQNFSLDPNTARDQMMQLMPLFEKIPGFDFRSLAEGIRLNVMDNFIDPLAQAKRRQRKIFRQMIRAHESAGSTAYVKPRDLEDHENMLNYCREFVMTNEYDLLEDATKQLVDDHVREREQLLADRKVKAAGPPAAPGGGLPPAMPVPPGPPMTLPGAV